MKTVVALYSRIICAIDVDNLLYSPLERFKPFDPCHTVYDDGSALLLLVPPQAITKHI